MRNAATFDPEDDRPRICAAIDMAIEEAGMTNRAVAAILGTSEQNVGRWRKRIDPGDDTVSAIEKALAPDKPLGWVWKLAGYVEDTEERDLLKLIRSTHHLSDGYRRIVLRVINEALDATVEERNEQASWRKTASTRRRSR